MGTEFRMDSIPGSLVVVGEFTSLGCLFWSKQVGAARNVLIFAKPMRYFLRLDHVLVLSISQGTILV